MTRTRELKIRLTESEFAAFERLAKTHHTSKADLVRYLVLSPKAPRQLPDRDILMKIQRHLTKISSNLEKVTRLSIDAAKAGSLTANQLAALHRVITAGAEAWSRPRRQLLQQLKRF